MSEQNYVLFDGEVSLRIEQEAVHLKAMGQYGDPVELNCEMCRVLAEKLLELASKLND